MYKAIRTAKQQKKHTIFIISLNLSSFSIVKVYRKTGIRKEIAKGNSAIPIMSMTLTASVVYTQGSGCDKTATNSKGPRICLTTCPATPVTPIPRDTLALRSKEQKLM